MGLKELVGFSGCETSEKVFGHRMIFYATVLLLVLLVSANAY